MTNVIEAGQRVTGLDLAQILEDQEGPFLCQQGGQTYIAVSKKGHSITSLRPYGRKFIEAAPVIGAQEPWVVERIHTDLIEGTVSQRRG